MMRFVREIPAENITNDVLALDQYGFTLVWKADSIEVYAEVADTSLESIKAA
jgi:hypothetical protein